MPAPITPIAYCRKHLDINGDFLSEWKRLSDKDREELKQWAQQELDGSAT